MRSFGGEKHRQLYHLKNLNSQSDGKDKPSILKISKLPKEQQAEALGLTGDLRKEFLADKTRHGDTIPSAQERWWKRVFGRRK